MSDTGSYGFGDDMDDIDALSDDGAFGDLLENGVYNDADEFLPVLINASGDPTDEGLVFRRLPDMPLEADTSSYFDEAFIAACLEAHERHCAMPRRLFEDIERVAQAEERAARQLARLATSKNLQASPSFRAPSLGASPSFSHRRSVDASSSVGNTFSHLFSSGIGASPNTSNGSPKYLTNFLSESFRRHPSMDATAAARDDASDGSSEDSMEEWRKTVVVPPRSPSPPPADPLRLRDDNDNTTLHSFLPSIRRKASDSQSRDFRSYSIVAAAPRLLEPLEVLYANRLLTPMSTVDIDALTTKGVIELVRLSPGVELSRRGEASYASHALVLVSGEVSLMHSGQPLSTIASQGAVLLEEECRGAPGSHRSIVTLVVGGEGLQAWAVPRIVVQRITMAVQNQRRLAARAATGVF